MIQNPRYNSPTNRYHCNNKLNNSSVLRNELTRAKLIAVSSNNLVHDENNKNNEGDTNKKPDKTKDLPGTIRMILKRANQLVNFGRREHIEYV